MSKNKLVLSILLSAGLITLSGCSLFDRSEKTQSLDVVVVSNVNNLKDGDYYTYDGKNYSQLYMGNSSFKPSSSGFSSNNSGITGHVIWLQDDYKKIPIMKSGDKIVYHSTSNLTTSLSIERFYDSGYSIGIANLNGDSSGRYSLDLSSSSLTIDPSSDAKKLQDISSSGSVIIDSIGKTPLRAGNVSPSGTIIGLEKNKIYSVNSYLGTDLYQKNIKADVRILESSETSSIEKYEFSEGKTVEFKFPNYYNSGYYLINGFGLVKYIASDTTKNSDDIDMNIPNVYPKDGEEGQDVSQKNINAEDLVTSTITLESDGEQEITITYSDSDDKKSPTPTAKLITPDGALPFENAKNNKLTLSTTLEKGDYEIQIIGLDGRTYSYKMKSKGDKTKKSSTKEKTDSSETKSLADIVNGN